MLAQECCAEDMVFPIQAEQRGQARDHPAWGALGPTESWHAGLDHEEGAAHEGTTCPIPQRFRSNVGMPKAPFLAAHAAYWHRFKTDIVPPKEDKGRQVPICRKGRHEINLVGDVQSSTVPLVLSPGGQGQGRQGAVAPQLLPHPQKEWPGKASWAGYDQHLLWLLHSESPEPFDGPQHLSCLSQ